MACASACLFTYLKFLPNTGRAIFFDARNTPFTSDLNHRLQPSLDLKDYPEVLRRIIYINLENSQGSYLLTNRDEHGNR